MSGPLNRAMRVSSDLYSFITDLPDDENLVPKALKKINDTVMQILPSLPTQVTKTMIEMQLKATNSHQDLKPELPELYPGYRKKRLLNTAAFLLQIITQDLATSEAFEKACKQSDMTAPISPDFDFNTFGIQRRMCVYLGDRKPLNVSPFVFAFLCNCRKVAETLLKRGVLLNFCTETSKNVTVPAVVAITCSDETIPTNVRMIYLRAVLKKCDPFPRQLYGDLWKRLMPYRQPTEEMFHLQLQVVKTDPKTGSLEPSEHPIKEKRTHLFFEVLDVDILAEDSQLHHYMIIIFCVFTNYGWRPPLSGPLRGTYHGSSFEDLLFKYHTTRQARTITAKNAIETYERVRVEISIPPEELGKTVDDATSLLLNANAQTVIKSYLPPDITRTRNAIADRCWELVFGDKPPKL